MSSRPTQTRLPSPFPRSSLLLPANSAQPRSYFMDYDGHEVVDAGQRGNAARFINHSCGPNLEVVRWRLAGVEEYQVRSRRLRFSAVLLQWDGADGGCCSDNAQMGLFALHDIPAGTELTCTSGSHSLAFAALARHYRRRV